VQQLVGGVLLQHLLIYGPIHLHAVAVQIKTHHAAGMGIRDELSFLPKAQQPGQQQATDKQQRQRTAGSEGEPPLPAGFRGESKRGRQIKIPLKVCSNPGDMSIKEQYAYLQGAAGQQADIPLQQPYGRQRGGGKGGKGRKGARRQPGGHKAAAAAATADDEEGLQGLGQSEDGADMLAITDEAEEQLWEDNGSSSDDKGEYEESSVSTENVYD
jgi:hypothetical protein